MKGGREAALHYFLRLGAVADFFFVGFFFAGVFFSGEIRNAASGVSLTSGRSSERTVGTTFFAMTHSMSGVSSGSSSSLPHAMSTFFRCAGLSSCAAFRIAPIRSMLEHALTARVLRGRGLPETELI